MEDKALAPLAVTSPIGLDNSILDKLETYDDYLGFYMQLEEASAAFSWLKADTLLKMTEKLGDKSLEQLGKDLREKRSTVINYVRTARAFPIDKREPAVSFSAHYQASFADSYNDQTSEFSGEKRFEWVKKVADEGLSTRQLAHAIQHEKKALLAENSEEEAWKFDGSNKAQELKSLIDGLMMGVNQGDKTAYDRLVSVYNKVYDETTN